MKRGNLELVVGVFVLAGLVPIGVDGGLQLVTEYESNNLLRVATGLLAGMVLALLLAHFMFALQDDKPRAEAASEEEAQGRPGQP